MSVATIVAAAPFLLAILVALCGRRLAGFLVDQVNLSKARQEGVYRVLEAQSWIAGFLFLGLGLVLLPDAFNVDIPLWGLVGIATMFLVVLLMAAVARGGGSRSARSGSYVLVTANVGAVIACVLVSTGHLGRLRDDAPEASSVLSSVHVTHPPGAAAEQYSVTAHLDGEPGKLGGRLPWVVSLRKDAGEVLTGVTATAFAPRPCVVDSTRQVVCEGVSIGNKADSGREFNVWLFLASPNQVTSILDRQSVSIDPRDALAPVPVTRARVKPSIDAPAPNAQPVQPGNLAVQGTGADDARLWLFDHDPGQGYTLDNESGNALEVRSGTWTLVDRGLAPGKIELVLVEANSACETGIKGLKPDKGGTIFTDSLPPSCSVVDTRPVTIR